MTQLGEIVKVLAAPFWNSAFDFSKCTFCGCVGHRPQVCNVCDHLGHLAILTFILHKASYIVWKISTIFDHLKNIMQKF